MYDGVAEIDKDPAAFVIALDAADCPAVTLDCFDDGVGNCARLNLRTPGDENEGIGKNRSSRDVDGGEIFAFLVERGLARDLDYIADMETSSSTLGAMPNVRAAAAVGGASGLPLAA